MRQILAIYSLRSDILSTTTFCISVAIHWDTEEDVPHGGATFWAATSLPRTIGVTMLAWPEECSKWAVDYGPLAARDAARRLETLQPTHPEDSA